jgi:hypothetical protein
LLRCIARQYACRCVSSAPAELRIVVLLLLLPLALVLQASDAQLAAAAAGKHLPVKPLEESVYQERLGDTAYLVRVYA